MVPCSAGWGRQEQASDVTQYTRWHRRRGVMLHPIHGFLAFTRTPEIIHTAHRAPACPRIPPSALRPSAPQPARPTALPGGGKRHGVHPIGVLGQGLQYG